MKESYIKDMKFLIRELHKEWEKSKPTKKQIVVTDNEAEIIKVIVAKSIMEQQDLLDNDEDICFKKSIKQTKENFVLLRIMKKVDRNLEKSKGAFVLELDSEEYKKYKSLMESMEGDSSGEEI